MTDGDPSRKQGRASWSHVPELRAGMTGLEIAQDVVILIVGAALVLLSVALLVAAVVDFFRSSGGVLARAGSFLDQVLLVLILVEIVHTVVLSLRSHELQPEPFIVVALIAAIRKLLFVLGGQQKLSTAQFALLLATAAIFIVALITVRVWGQPPSRLDPPGDQPARHP